MCLVIIIGLICLFLREEIPVWIPERYGLMSLCILRKETNIVLRKQ